MANTDVLEGLECPECHSSEPLKIEVSTIVLFFDEGSEETGDMEWDQESYCECGSCHHAGTVAEFTIPEEEVIEE